MVVLSLLLHGGAFAAISYAQWLKAPRPQIQNAIPVELVKLGKPRDPNLLPRKVRPPPPPPDEGINLDTKNSKKPPPKRRKPEKTQDKMSDAARRLLEARPDPDLDKALAKIEEDEGAADGSIYGTTTDPNKAAKGYAAKVSALLHQRYSVPELIPKAQRRFLVAEVILYVESSGRISRHEFIKEHPNKLFMNALVRLLKTTTLPPPPKELASQYRREGLAIRFKAGN